MRLTVMQQLSKGIADGLQPADSSLDPAASLERIKWFLWHGNVFEALQVLGVVQEDLEEAGSHCHAPSVMKLLRLLRKFAGYIRLNQAFIHNYGDRHRYGEIISTAFVESTVNFVLSKRFVKKQQMCGTQQGAHLLLQVRLQVLNQDWRSTFER